ncbi:excinuclease ABC subunit UvrC [Helicobacter anatolicus]|uniref:excinuclease ABC subunit UvrC n=1 Tax=Helicobacter anatolicus TaxID=2905874 RepID=UPI001E3C1595|nr:excinuclease ABC subunit UvrC [Helicobacter anatolicus]MCE3037702.1 excinuclease ABC subunit UvrC [Helicobacter anatolicus]
MITPQTLNNLPTTFGIYQYFDSQGKLLYVGKAKNIKKRVKSYFKFQENHLIPNPKNSQRIQIMIAQAYHINTIIVSNEQDALLLENSLIKQLKPKYNILLRDDKTYPYIMVDLNTPFPFFEITRKVISKKNIQYFGPYPTGARDILDSLYDLLPLVQKKSCIKSKKACLFHQINKCPAPCEQKITKEAYATTTQEALHLLLHKEKLLTKMREKMQNLAEKLLFEEANLYKNRIEKIASISNFSEISYHKPYNLDIISIAKQTQNKEHIAILIKLFMREGKIIASDYELIKSDYEIDDSAVFTQHILNHYKEKLPILPESILFSQPLINTQELQDFIYNTQDKKLPIQFPKTGYKKTLIQIAEKNAQELLRQKIILKNKDEEILYLIKQGFNLSQTPFRIEIFDTSHHSFTFNVGAMVTYENNAFNKPSYRHYNLTSKDEYSQMQELLTHRIKSFSKNPPPNLWIIDGGKGQLNIAHELLESAGVDIDILAISKEKIDFKAHRAKGNAKDTIHSLQYSYKLDTQDKKLQFIQKLRDEVHRFAISFHRHKKTKDISKNLPYTLAQQKKLLQYFGDFTTLQNAPQELIKKILSSRDKN